ncbi:MAG: OsmC family protein [Candidatus Thalassarchaeaceae archaeon]|nr:OsmC family protein [Candidatus Thalassarchaeaceae archaeon]
MKYEGDLRCTATHIPSGKKLITDAPIDNHGKGESFSPTDLLATSMLTCIMTIIGIKAEKKNMQIEGMYGSVEKIMTSNPRRISRLEIRITLPNNNDISDREWLITEGCDCPVCHSVSESMEIDIKFND